jgi:hypothetical protein
MPPYTRDEANELHEVLEERINAAQHLLLDFTTFNYRTREGKDFGKEGFGRRLKTMYKSARYVFDELPPELDAIPEDDARERAAIMLQTFVLNTFGCTDCLSWVWVHEKAVRRANGNEIGKMQVGLKADQELRAHLPIALQNHMAAIDAWFDTLKDARDHLMHRIPIYIPPYLVAPERADAYNALSVRMDEALGRGRLAEYHRLEAEQMALCHYLPLISYRRSAEAPPRLAPLHKLLVADLLTITDLGQRFMAQLRLP